MHHVIESPEEYELFYYWDTNQSLLTSDMYPETYPCIAERIETISSTGDFIMKDKIIYCHDLADCNSWLEGFEMSRSK